MTLHINCARCDKEIEEPGALLFSPPDKDGKTIKTHFCVPCYKNIIIAVMHANGTLESDSKFKRPDYYY